MNLYSIEIIFTKKVTIEFRINFEINCSWTTGIFMEKNTSEISNSIKKIGETSFSQIYHYYIRVTKFHTTGDFRKVVWMQCQSSWPITSSSMLLPPLQICSPFIDTFYKYMVLVPINLIHFGSWSNIKCKIYIERLNITLLICIKL